MNKEISFFGFTFTILTFCLLALAWTISLFSIWPYFMEVSSGWVYIFYSVAALVFAAFVNRKILFLLMLIFYFSKTLIVWFQNFMLMLSGFLATLIYLFFVPMSFWKFTAHFLIITFSVYVYYTLLIKAIRITEEE